MDEKDGFTTEEDPLYPKRDKDPRENGRLTQILTKLDEVLLSFGICYGGF